MAYYTIEEENNKHNVKKYSTLAIGPLSEAGNSDTGEPRKKEVLRSEPVPLYSRNVIPIYF